MRSCFSLLVALAVLSSACGGAVRPAIEPGERPTLDADAVCSSTTARAVVLRNRKPVGAALVGDAWKAQASNRGRADILGRHDRGGIRALYRFTEYEESWRRGVCYWQVPFAWTLSVFWALLPLAYPCYGDFTIPWAVIEQYAREEAATRGANYVAVALSEVPAGIVGARLWFYCLSPSSETVAIDRATVLRDQNLTKY